MTETDHIDRPELARMRMRRGGHSYLAWQGTQPEKTIRDPEPGETPLSPSEMEIALRMPPGHWTT